MPCLLLLDVLPDHVSECSATASGKAGRRPTSFLRMLGAFFLRIMRLETPFRLFTSTYTATLGGSFTKK